jgi:hypothetical protein
LGYEIEGFSEMSDSNRTLACLFLSKHGALAVHLVDRPVPEKYHIPAVPPGMMHALRVLGMTDQVRVFKRIASGQLPVYQEL